MIGATVSVATAAALAGGTAVVLAVETAWGNPGLLRSLIDTTVNQT